jgi:two-component system alkaline phosphatase synthesis response regulator PhoP
VLSNILIVDDESELVELLKFRLGKLGCGFLEANDGIHALTQAREGRPDLILLDIMLPDLDGIAVCEILKRGPVTKKIPIIFMSALTSGATRRTVDRYAEDFFTKPLDLNRLESRITELLRLEVGNE